VQRPERIIHYSHVRILYERELLTFSVTPYCDVLFVMKMSSNLLFEWFAISTNIIFKTVKFRYRIHLTDLGAGQTSFKSLAMYC
jgi:hypothetical protein